FFKFLVRESEVSANPFIHVSLPKADKQIPCSLYMVELEKLIEVSDLTDPIGEMNHAILETIYATVMRVSECQMVLLDSIDFSICTMFVKGKGRKERYVPFGQFAENALKTYIREGRKVLEAKAKSSTDTVFLNARGNPLTARGMRMILNKIV